MRYYELDKSIISLDNILSVQSDLNELIITYNNGVIIRVAVSIDAIDNEYKTICNLLNGERDESVDRDLKDAFKNGYDVAKNEESEVK